MKKVSFILVLLMIILGCSHKLAPTQATQKLGPNPYFEFDGKPVEFSYLKTVNPMDISVIHNYYNKEAIKLYGEKAKDGAVLIETRTYAKNNFEAFFKRCSGEYGEMINKTDTSDIQYILNERILKKNIEGDLSLITEKTLKSIKLIDSQELENKYQVKDKKVGVIVEAKRPKDLYNSKKKF
jgi:hypothetical protein